MNYFNDFEEQTIRQLANVIVTNAKKEKYTLKKLVKEIEEEKQNYSINNKNYNMLLKTIFNNLY